MTYGTATPDLATVIEALSDPSRRSLIEALRAGPQPVVRLAEGVPISRPAVSQHLRVLSDAGLVTVRQEGTRRYYGLHPEGFAALRDYLDTLWNGTSFYGHWAEEELDVEYTFYALLALGHLS